MTDEPRHFAWRTVDDDRSITEEIALQALLALPLEHMQRVMREALALRTFDLEIAALELGNLPPAEPDDEPGTT